MKKFVVFISCIVVCSCAHAMHRPMYRPMYQPNMYTLHEAAARGDECMIKALLPDHSDVDQLDDKGLSPLHLAIINNHSGVVKLLLSAGAGVLKKNRQGWTPLQLATFNGCQEIAQLIKDQMTRQRMLTLACARHARLGVSSKASDLPEYIFNEIYTWLKQVDKK